MPDLKSRSPLLANLLLAAVAIFMALALAEIGLRVSAHEAPKPPSGPRENWVLVPERVWTEYHPVLGWYHQKNKTAVHTIAKQEIEIHTNSQGFRGTREYDLLKTTPYRIVALGDSFVFGFGVTDDAVFTAQLEKMRPDLEVINLGVAGYGVDQLLMSYRVIGRHYQADIVLIGIFEEGFWRATRAFADSGHAKPYFSLNPYGSLELHNVPVPEPYSLKTGQFPPLVQKGPLEQVLEKSLLYQRIKKAMMRLGKNLGILDPDLTTEWIVGKAILRDLVYEIRRTGSRPVLLIIPSEYWVKNSRPTSLAKSLHRFAKQHQVDVIDTTPSFYRAIQEKTFHHYYIKGDGHWTREGHQLAADMILNYLKKR